MILVSHHTYTEHHHPPQSRGGTQTTELPKKFHQSFHVVFHNLKGDELLVFIKDLLILLEEKEKITAGELHDLREAIKRGDAQWT